MARRPTSHPPATASAALEKFRAGLGATLSGLTLEQRLFAAEALTELVRDHTRDLLANEMIQRNDVRALLTLLDFPAALEAVSAMSRELAALRESLRMQLEADHA